MDRPHEAEPVGASPTGPAQRYASALVRHESGAPAAGVECVLHRLLTLEPGGMDAAPPADIEPRALGVTGADGTIAFPLERPAVLVATANGRTGAVRVLPGLRSTLDLVGARRTLTVIDDATDDPLAGRVFPIAWDNGPRRAAYFLRTDERGTIEIPIGAGLFETRRGKLRLFFKSLTIDGKKSSLKVNKFKVQGQLRAEDTQLVARMVNDERHLLLIDDVTGAKINGNAFANKQSLRLGDRAWGGVAVDDTVPVVAGRMTVGRWFSAPNPDQSPDVVRRFIAVGGYQTKYFESSVDLENAEVRLTPAAPRWLRILDASGAPLQTSAWVRFGEGHLVNLTSDGSGLAGPLTWTPGEEWEVRCDRFGPGEDEHIIASTDLAASEIVDVRPRYQPARIVVTGVPDRAAELIAIAARGAQWTGRRAGNVVSFDGLHGGNYAVGPAVWANQLNARVPFSGFGGAPAEKTTPLHVAVEAGGETILAWNPHWAMDREMRGRVVSANATGENLAVLPLFGTTGTHMYFGPRTPWLPVTRSGEFVIPGGEPRPAALLFARIVLGPFGEQPMPLDCQPVRADGEYRLQLTSFEITAKNAAALPDGLTVSVRPLGTGDAFSAPMTCLSGLSERRWNPKEPLRWEGLGAQVDGLRLSGGAYPKEVTVAISPGSHTRLELSVPAPEAAERSPK